ncbi:MAG: PAS domain S-box protein [Actinomycetota bacterium]
MKNPDSQGYDSEATPPEICYQNQAKPGSLLYREQGRKLPAEFRDQAAICFRSLVDSTSLLLWMSDADSRCTFLNSAWLEFSAHNLAEKLETGWLKGVHPEDVQHCLSRYQEALKTRSRFQVEYRLRLKKNCEYRWMIDTAVPQWTAEGDFAGYAGMSLEISNLNSPQDDPQLPLKLTSHQLLSTFYQYRHQLEATIAAQSATPRWANSLLPGIDPSQKREEVQPENDEQFRAIFEQAAIGITNISPEGRYIRTNQRFCEIVGYTAEELQQLTFHQITHPDDLGVNLAKRQACLTNQIQTFSIEKRYIRKDGSLVWVNLTASIVRDGQGNPKYDIAIIEDISDRKQAESALTAERQRLFALLDQLPAYVYLQGPDRSLKFTNRYFRDHFEAPETQGKGEGMDGRDWCFPACPTATAFQEAQTEKWEWTGFDDRTYQIYDFPFTDIDGQQLMLELGIDITDRKQAEEALRQTEEKYRSLFENAIEGIFQTTSDGYYLNANPALARIYGYASPQELMVHLTDIEHQLYVEPHRRTEFIHLLQEHDAVEDFESQVYRADGSVIWISENARAVRDHSGKLLYYEGTVEDITQRKQLADKERLMAAITADIRQSLNLEEILNTAVAQVRQFLQADRVIIYRFQADGSKTVAVESVGGGWQPMQAANSLDAGAIATCFTEACTQGEIQAVGDIYTAGLEESALEWLVQHQVRAHLAMPILRRTNEFSRVQGETLRTAGDPGTGEKAMTSLTSQSPGKATTSKLVHSPQLWGLLVAHHCSGPRQWQPVEMDLLQQLAAQLAIAIQQAELYQQLQEANQELERLATLDGLTLIANRRRFDKYFDAEWRLALQEQRPISLILCDVDFFKFYNDTYGHQAGDACLQKIASAINCAVEHCQRRFRQGTAADRLYLAARYGGEEFAVILPDTAATVAVQVAKAVRSAVARLKLPHLKSAVSQYVSLSLGVATAVPVASTRSVELIAAADKALYAAKQQGRDRIQQLEINQYL